MDSQPATQRTQSSLLQPPPLNESIGVFKWCACHKEDSNRSPNSANGTPTTQSALIRPPYPPESNDTILWDICSRMRRSFRSCISISSSCAAFSRICAVTRLRIRSRSSPSCASASSVATRAASKRSAPATSNDIGDGVARCRRAAPSNHLLGDRKLETLSRRVPNRMRCATELFCATKNQQYHTFAA